MQYRNTSWIPILAAIVMIPQLLFWWLAPGAAAARLAVYIGGSLLTLAIPLCWLLTYWNSDLRKTAGLSLVAGVLELAVVVLSAVLLAINVTVRSAVFALLIMALVCLILLLPLICAALKQPRQGVYSASIAGAPGRPQLRIREAAPAPAPVCRQQTAVPEPAPRTPTVSKPLPPRNR